MSQEPVEVTPPTVLDQEQPLLHDETGSSAHASGPMVVLPKPSEGPTPQNQKYLRQRVRHWICRPSMKVFIALFIVAVLSFCPALLSNLSPADRMDYRGLTSATTGINANTTGMYMDGIIFGFDWSGTQTLSVVWNPFRVPVAPPEGVPYNDTHTWNAAWIYIDNASDPAFYYAPVNFTLVIPDTGEANGAYVIPFETGLSVLFSDQYYFPEDGCDFGAMIFVLDEATNGSVPIIKFSLDSSGPGDFSTVSSIRELSLKFVYDAGSGPTVEWVQAYYMDATIKRSLRARAITYSMFTINWILTLSSIITTSVMFNRRGEGKDTVALLPITVILTIPVIRSLYVGSPPYGIFLDVVGFFPQMLTVVACTVVVLSGFAIQSIRGGSISHGKEDV